MESCPSGRRCSTRNAVSRKGPRVRIPNSPPESPVNMRVCWTFLFCSSSENDAKSWKEQAVLRELGGFGFFPLFEPINQPALLLSAISAHLLPKSTVSGNAIPFTIACAEDSLGCNPDGRRYSPWWKKIAVPQPVLNLLERHAVCKQEMPAMAQIVKAHTL